MDAAPVLLTSAQLTSTTVLLAEAAARRGVEVMTLDSPVPPEALMGRIVHWYGGPLRAPVTPGPGGWRSGQPGSDDWLVGPPEEFTGRRIELNTLSEAWSDHRPRFAKRSDKQFPAAVYADGSRLPREGERIGPWPSRRLHR
ncbi:MULTISPECIES: hypothetical protein [Streptacidiphilus]|uniref:ATP-grasp domain-containing protein n=1 Tax=Streptacidiphilus cavernicola TaxID=3342716 RepID=A0ABV6UQ45_9ACTN|nr:hypothetical protein [Streptacidiphilus jeojiense]